ncbi:truncated carbamoylphosphate synthase small subunit [Candidatus Carsonella ruddii HT isolate Thao2000]|uniref:carbamoyl-phosphate synthase (glutamine-hydrolyzing) n=1 Tax=Candidatus Carsonella ruddii HT isolate Thao2000 TaxID=1202539 RepID=J3TEF7_CARRU|nr:carbamoylphosphate synthase small subunit [Candidatus Carsonella ruddii]AFP84112.1 truncated carbamoylphosphate synthase small subunit [Candidatus Carsonella ruddii HT isolate Thao2000]
MIKILLINIGCKISIIKNLIKKKYFVYEFNKKNNILFLSKINGVFISNGPGNPFFYKKKFYLILFFMFLKIPILSICLGYQIISILSKFNFFKLKIGFHGFNHSLIDKSNTILYINSQNHNFNIKKYNIKNFNNTFFSIFDNTLQNINSLIQPLIGFQNHPEGESGSNDLKYLFNYYNNIYE